MMNVHMQFKKIAAGLAVACMFLLPFQMKAVSAAEYEIVFKGGAHGSVDGQEKISHRLSSEDYFPNEPQIESEDGYVFTGWSKELPAPGSKVEGKQVFVAKYAVLIDGLTYTVRYVDENGADIATPRTMLAEKNSEITERAKVVAGYSFQQAQQTFTLKEENQEIRFVYSLIDPNEVIRYETTIENEYIDQIVEVPGDAGQQGTAAQGQGGTGTTQQGSVNAQNPQGDTPSEPIENNDTPLSSGEEEDIENNDTPLSKGETKNDYAMIGGIGALVVVAIGVAVYAIKRRKAGESAE